MIYKGQTIYQKTDNGAINFNITHYVAQKNQRVRFNEKEKVGVTFTKADITNSTLFKKGTATVIANSDLPANEIFFPYDDNNLKKSNPIVYSYKGKRFKYLDGTPVFQAMTVPIKYRLKYNDTIKDIASGSLNLGAAFGWKLTHNVYRNVYKKDDNTYLAGKTNKFSVTFGGFIGPTTIDLKATTTKENGVFGRIKKDKERTILGIAPGALIVFGVNQVNLGLCVGIDLPIGSGGEWWIYRDRPWLGFVVAFDLIK